MFNTYMRKGALALGVIVIFILLGASSKLIEVLEADRVMVIQSISGGLNCYTDPGPVWQGLGDVTKYPRRGTYSFDLRKEGPGGALLEDTGKPIQFNDGGTGTLYGSVNWEMPLDCKQIIAIHKTFSGPAGVELQGVGRMVNSAVYLSGTNMSPTESAAERRGELLELINDQAQNGVYQTVTKDVERVDPISGEKRWMAAVQIVRGEDGKPKRQQGSILDQFSIKLQPMSIERLVYSKTVAEQIAKRQEATQQVQLAQANARKAEQDAITVEAQGRAKAAEAKWEQEAIKARLVTEAQQKLDVATLGAKEAEQYKREQILRGEGDSERRRLVMTADGALDQKLEAYRAVHQAWATAFTNFKGQLVPQVTMGGTVGSTGNGATSVQSLMDLISVKTAKDLAVDFSLPAKK